MPTEFIPRLRNCDLTAPTGDEIRFVLRTVEPERFEEYWTEACEQVEIPTYANIIPLDKLELIAELLSEKPGPAGLAGRTVAVRVGAYRAFQKIEGPDRERDWGRRTQEELVFNRMPTKSRMQEVANYDLFAPQTRYRLDAAAARVADTVGAEIALISALVEGAQLFVGSRGVSGWMETNQGVPIEWSICSTMVRTKEPHQVIDGHNDVIERLNPTIALTDVQSYIGVPLVSRSGFVIGSVCALGHDPYQFDDTDRAKLRHLGQEILSSIDPNKRFEI